MNSYKAIIKKNGSTSKKIRSILKEFGRNRKKYLPDINKIFNLFGLYTYPQLTEEDDLDESSTISDLPLGNRGDLFTDEMEFHKFFNEQKAYEQFGLTKAPDHEYKPDHARDEIDFFGEDKQGRKVVIELKNTDGQKHVVEQVLRYKGYIKRKFPGSKIRGIIITGEFDPDIAFAFKGMEEEQRRNIEWYIYKYSSETGKIHFVRMLIK